MPPFNTSFFFIVLFKKRKKKDRFLDKTLVLFKVGLMRAFLLYFLTYFTRKCYIV